MPKGLNANKVFSEQIRLIVKTDDLTAVIDGAMRIAELQKKGYKLVETYIEATENGNEQNYYFES